MRGRAKVMMIKIVTKPDRTGNTRSFLYIPARLYQLETPANTFKHRIGVGCEAIRFL
jgi:hypothetical protein